MFTLSWYLTVGQTIAAIYREELGRNPVDGDEEAIANWLYHAREHGRDADWIRDRIRESDEFLNPPPPPPVPEPEPPPPPPPPSPPPPPPVVDVDPRTADLHALRAFVIAAGQASIYYPHAQAGDKVAAHRVTRDICKALAAKNSRWGLITKTGNQFKCTWDACGNQLPDGYGEDVVAFRPGDSMIDWLGYDVIVGAGAPGARVDFSGPLDRRPDNLWAPLP